MTESQSTLFAEDTHASPSALPGSEQARKMTATSGLKFSGLSKKSGPLGSCVKTLLGTSAWASTVCCLNWKARGINSKYSLFQLVPSAPSTEGIESGLLPAPTAAQGGGERSGNRKGTGNLEFMARKNLWPTPTVSTGAQTKENPTPGQTGGTSLAGAVNVANQETGSLNPEFVEWLMGFPIGHTDLNS